MIRSVLRFVLVLAMFACCTDQQAAEAAEAAGEWKFISNKGGVALYRRERTASYESKAIGEIDASTQLAHAVINDLESYASFMPYTAECRVLKREADSVVVYQRISAPLTSDRDYTVRVRSSSKAVEGGMSYFSQWNTENALGPPEKAGVVRVKLCEGSWLLEPAGPNKTRATYMIYTDSGGMIPTFIKNTGSQIGIRKLFDAVRKQVRDPKYAAKN
ncbi:MAG TPA: START domain-containing protein [Chthoniobacterales bacterium]